MMKRKNIIRESLDPLKKELFKHEGVITRSSHYSTVICPHCERKFAPQASLRHIPICANMFNKAKKLSDTIKTFLNKKRTMGMLVPDIQETFLEKRLE